MKETWVPSLGWEDPLEKEMATHSSILAWKFAWTEEPGGYSPRGGVESDTTEWLSARTLCCPRASLSQSSAGCSTAARRLQRERPWCWERLQAKVERGGRPDNIADSMDMNLRKLWKIVKDRWAWRAAVHGVAKNWTWLSNWTTTKGEGFDFCWTGQVSPSLWIDTHHSQSGMKTKGLGQSGFPPVLGQ